MNFSYWEKKHFLNYDYILVGSGITGLSAAIELKSKEPKSSVLVLERGVLPSGASSKNAGFACFGSLSEILDDLNQMPKDLCLKLIEKRWRGLQNLRDLLGDKNIGFQACGGFELITKEQEHILDKMQEINQFLNPLFKQNVFEKANEKIDAFAFNKAEVKHLLWNKFEAAIETGLMLKNLLRKAQDLGVVVLNGAEVKSWEISGNGVEIICAKELHFRANQLGICSNAFAKTLLPDLDIRPGRALVLITKELEHIPFNGVFHYDRGYYYFRNIDNRILLGGGRNLDFETENTTEFGINPLIQKDLEEKLKTIFEAKLNLEVDYYWSGIMAFGPNKTTLQARENSHVSYALRLGGMGVAIGSLMGKELAEEMLNRN